MQLILSSKNTFIVVDMSGKVRQEFADSRTARRRLEEMGVRYDAIVEAMKDLEDKQNNVAHFGIYGTFMFSENMKGYSQWH